MELREKLLALFRSPPVCGRGGDSAGTVDIDRLTDMTLALIKDTGYISPSEVAEYDKIQLESERMLNREAAYEEHRLQGEVEYWKAKSYRLG